ncbi:MAG: hypothetical protein NT001_00390 [Candidatus Woesearchaeota archaeon]|nr:hypothetical protein [Candidatus Woesearchaeota archaeon]
MVSKLYLERAQNEFELARIIIQITGDEKMQKEVFKVSSPLTFYSAVISHSYYCRSTGRLTRPSRNWLTKESLMSSY